MQQSNDRFAAVDLHREDSYARTYSTANDFAIACALNEIQASAIEPTPPPEDTSHDRELAQQLYDEELARQLQDKEMARERKTRAKRFDKRLRKLLGGLSMRKVIPRINPLRVPSATATSEDRQRLLLRLDMYALKEREVVGDGACQFRAIADQLWFQQGLHQEVREAVVAQLVQHAHHFQNYVTTDYPQYVNSMRQAGTWGDHVTLQAAADAFNCRICVISSFLDNCVISITPTEQQDEQQQQQQRQPSEQELMQQAGQQRRPPRPHGSGGSDYSDRTLWLSFWAEVHYNSIAPRAPSPPSEGEFSSSSEDELPQRSKVEHTAGHSIPSMLACFHGPGSVH